MNVFIVDNQYALICIHYKKNKWLQQVYVSLCHIKKPHHVVGPFARMAIRQAFWHYFVEHHLHVVSDIRIPALVKREARRCVHYWKQHAPLGSISWLPRASLDRSTVGAIAPAAKPLYMYTAIRESRQIKCRANMTSGRGCIIGGKNAILTGDGYSLWIWQRPTANCDSSGTCLRISSVTRCTPRCCGLKFSFRWNHADPIWIPRFEAMFNF